METAIVKVSELQEIVNLVVNSANSPLTQRAYQKALVDFLTWRGDRPVTKALVNEYKQTMMDNLPKMNQALSAIKKLVVEAKDNGLIDPVIAAGIQEVKGVKALGDSTGNWLSKKDAQALLDAPNLKTLKGIRDRAILAVMIGAGLRRSEVVKLTVNHIRMLDSRWVIVDLVGKKNHKRSIPISSWVKQAIDEWQKVANITDGIIFRAVNRGDYVTHGNMTAQAVQDIVKQYGYAIGRPEIAPHDLRRTYAKLAHKGGAGIDQIQLSLGHMSIKTTEIYLGVEQNLTDAPGDRLGLSL